MKIGFQAALRRVVRRRPSSIDCFWFVFRYDAGHTTEKMEEFEADSAEIAKAKTGEQGAYEVILAYQLRTGRDKQPT